MSDENEKPRWRVFGSSVKGASHVRSGLPNQDAILWKTGENGELPLVLAIADGHGSDRYFRSDIGAKLAVQVAVEVMVNFANEIPDSMTNYALIKSLAKQLPEEIVQKWKGAVEKHLSDVPFFTKQEFERFRKPEHEKEFRAVLQSIQSDQTLPYGATLLTALVTSTFIIYFQLGDGDIVKVMSSGESIKPVRGDARLIANETTSLCSPTAVQDFRKYIDTFDKDELPALIMLSTDGYSNSFISQDGFLKVGSDILRMLRTDGLEKVEHSVEGWLQKATQDGSGDDISLGIICELNALKASASLPNGPVVHIREEDILTTRRSPAESYADSRTAPASISQLDTVVTPQTEKKQEQGLLVASAQNQSATDTPVQPINPKEEVKHNETPAVIEGGRKVLVVSPQPGAGHYTTISAALKDPSPNVRIEVLPGNYTEDKLFITQNIELIAKGPREQVVIESKSNNTPCLQIWAKQAVIQGFTLRTKVGLIHKDKAVVEILGGQSTLSQCDITSKSLLAVSVENPKTSPTITECTIHHSEGRGIRFSNGAGGRLEQSQVYGTKGTGIVVERRSNPMISHCHVSGGRSRGLLFSDRAGGRLEHCEVFENAGSGIVIEGESNPTIVNCTIRDGLSEGLVVQQNGSGLIEKCIFKANTSTGILIVQSDPVIQGCEVAGGKEDAIVIAGQSKGTIQDCRIVENAGRGIDITENSAPLIKGCRLFGGKGTGIAISNQAGGVIEDCVLEQVESAGIRISQRANPVIRKCKVSGGKRAGVRVEKQGTGTLENCEIEGNAEIGVLVTEESKIKINGGHILRLQDKYMCALMVDDRSVARVERCRIEDHDHIGVIAQGHSGVFLRMCSVKGGYYAAVVSQHSDMYLDESSCQTTDSRNKSYTYEEGSSLYIDGKRC